jgi:uncharacterized protein YcbX
MATPHAAALWRYPVKSMAGERCARSHLDARGLAGDRAMAVQDTGSSLIASAKRPALWGALLACRARQDGEAVLIALPEGDEVRSRDPDVDARLSTLVGRPVRLTATPPEGANIERIHPDVDRLAPRDRRPAQPGTVTVGPLGAGAPPGTFFDFAPVHLVTRASLDALAAEVPEAGNVRRFRPNIVVDGDLAPFAENDWPGAHLRVGDVLLRVLTASPRCVVPSLPQVGVTSAPDVLRAVARANRVDVLDLGRHGCVGVYARVVEPGVVAEGDPVEIAP